MMSLDRVMSRAVQPISQNRPAENKTRTCIIHSCPVPEKSDSAQIDPVLKLRDHTGASDVDHASLSEQHTKEAQELCAEIKEKISAIATDENNSAVPSIGAGLTLAPNKTAPAVEKFPLSIIAQSVIAAYSAFTSFIGPNADPQERIVFSAISAVSAAMRSLFPIVKEALTTLQDSHPILAVISLALAAVHVAISSIATLIATRNFPPALSGNNETSESESKLNDLEDSFKLFLEKISKKLDALRKNGLVGTLGAVREWLMLSSAVVSLLNVLPIVIKTVAPIISAPIAAIVGGSINLVSAIVELAQGVKEYISLGEDLKSLKADLNQAQADKCSADEIAKLNAKIENKENELSASKVRIGKALVGIFTSVASIALGVLAIAVSISVPVLPAILTSISVLSVVVYVVVSIAVKLKQLPEKAEAKQTPSSPGYTSDTEDSLSDEGAVIV